MDARIQQVLCKSQQVLLGISTGSFYPCDMALGKRIKEARLKCGLKQEQLVALVPGATQQSLSILENRDSRTSVLLFGYADALQVSPRWLQDGIGSSGLPASAPKRTGTRKASPIGPPT